MNEFCQLLAGGVRAELNHVYTEKPFHTSTGMDMGWFCREHALHVGALAEALGHRAQLCRGDVLVNVPGSVKFFTMGSGADHAWCRIDDKAPIDASVTLKHLAPQRIDVLGVCPDSQELLSGFRLRYEVGTDDAMFANVLSDDQSLIAYNEKMLELRRPIALLATPFDFLHPPPADHPSFTDLFGDDVFFAITAHLLKLARREVNPMRTYLSPIDAVRAMVKHNPRAREQLSCA